MGEVFGKYELVRRIGVGGMAEVFEARGHGAAGFIKEMVIKRILPVFNEDPEFVRLFIKEARLAAKLQNANIVQIFDFNQVNGVHYIAMEWVHGQDLRRISQASQRRDIPLPASLCAYVGMEALKGLHYAHTRLDGGSPMGLVHRDISPHNILISFSGEVKIADFGIAKVAALASTVRSGGSIKGKLPYMSPEQVNARPVDARSDLFSLGIVLWELLTGRRLYQGGTEAEIFAQVQRADIPRPTAFVSGIPRDLETVIMDLLAPDPHRRYQSAQEALSDLGRFAGPEDPMETAAFLKRLLPEEAHRDSRGQTEVQPGSDAAGAGAGHDPAMIPIQDPVAGEASVPVIEPSPAPEPARSATDPATSEPGGDTPRRSMSWLGLALAALGCFILAGFGGRLLTGSGRSAASPGQGVPAEDKVSSMILRTTSGGRPISVEGVELGADPIQVHGPRGGRLQVKAGEGTALTSRQAVMGEADALELKLQAPTPPAPDIGLPPDAAAFRPDASPARAPANRLKGPAAQAAMVRPRAGRRPPASGAPGLLDIFVSPWAQVKVDGRAVGQTPIKNYRLSAGRHRVELINPGLGRRERVTVTVKAGQRTAPIRRRWDE